MQSRSLLTAFSVLSMAALASMPARAAAPFTASRFSITFPTGWQMLPVTSGGDSLMAVLNPTLLSYCYMTVTTTDHPLTAQELEAYRETYAGSDSVTKVADGTKSLGGKTFTFVEYQSADTSSGPSRVRIYYTNSGTNLFTSVLIYDPAAGAGAVTDMESALATLSLSASPIHAWMARSRPAGQASIHDILGRSRPLSARTALYRLPLP